MSALKATPIKPDFAAVVSGVDISQPLQRDDYEAIEDAINRYSVLVFRDQPITDEQQLDFSRHFGELEFPSATTRMDVEGTRRLKYRELSDISNLDKDGNVRPPDSRALFYSRANRLWHTDASFRKVPARLSMLAAHEVPSKGAETEYADMRAAYDSLPDDLKAQIEHLVAEHSIVYSHSLIGYNEFLNEEHDALPPALQRLVRVHPGSGRKTLYLASHASHIVDMPLEEGRALLDRLMELATKPEFVYRHEWRVNDYVIWDDRCTMHRGRPYADSSERRDLRRTTIRDVASTLETVA